MSYLLAYRQMDIPKFGRDVEGVKKVEKPKPVVEAPTGHDVATALLYSDFVAA